MAVAPYDDQTIAADDLLIRRIMADHGHADGEEPYVSTQAIGYSSIDHGMSVSLVSSIVKAGADPKMFYSEIPGCRGSIAWRVGDIRNEGMIVGLDPDPDNPHHAQIWSATGSKNMTGGKKRRLRELAGGYYAIF